MNIQPMLALLLTALIFAAPSATAHAPQSSISLNAYQCPADYDQVSDCTRLDGVVVSVTQDGRPHGEIVSSATEGAELEVMFGAAIELSVVGGQPAGTVLEDTALGFDAVEGVNAVTLTFVTQEAPAPEPPHSDTNALVVEALLCPADYAGDNYARDCPGERGIDVTVTRAADGFTATQKTGSDGITGFQGLGEGDYTVEVGVPGDFAGFLTVCGTPNDTEPRQVTNPDTNRIGVYLGPTEELTCTFFIVLEDAKGEPSPPQPTPAGPVTDLPSTGTGDTPQGASSLAALSLVLGTSISLVLVGALRLRQRRA